MPKQSEQFRQTRNLDAAENTRAELGFAGVSPRHIAHEAGVNLASQRAEVRAAFLKALQRRLPQVHLPALLWHMEFVWGVLAFTPRRLPHPDSAQTEALSFAALSARFLPPCAAIQECLYHE